MLKSKLSLIVAALGLAAVSFAGQDGYSLKRTPKVGETLKYKQTGKFEAGGQQIEYQALSTEKVVKVEDNGNYVRESTTADVKINGEDAPGGGGGGKNSTTFTAKGDVVEIKGDAVEANTYRFGNLALFITPDTDVKAGDTWTYDIKEDKKTGAVAGKATYTLVGEDKIGSTDVLKVKFSIKEAGSDGASSEGTLWLNKTDITLMKLTAKWVNAPVPGAPVLINGEITLELVP